MEQTQVQGMGLGWHGGTTATTHPASPCPQGLITMPLSWLHSAQAVSWHFAPRASAPAMVGCTVPGPNLWLQPSSRASPLKGTAKGNVSTAVPGEANALLNLRAELPVLKGQQQREMEVTLFSF